MELVIPLSGQDLILDTTNKTFHQFYKIFRSRDDYLQHLITQYYLIERLISSTFNQKTWTSIINIM